MAIVQNIDLNLIPDSEAVVVKVNQYDDGTGRIKAHLYLNDTAYTPASGATVRIEGTKPDKHGFSYTASISGNTVTANLTTQMTAVAGRTRAQIIVEEPSGKTGTFAFWLDVQAAALVDDTDISDTEIPAIMDLARQNAAIASAAAENAEASAEGAARSAEDAEDSASAAAQSASNASSAASTASTKAGEAAASATSAAGSATAASGSATTASDYATQAKSWAVGPSGTGTSGTDTNNSKYWADQAAQSASEAEQYAQGGLIYRGSILFANIPTTNLKAGDMYNIEDDFTTDSRFQEGAGFSVKAGTNIAWNGTKWDLLAVGGGSEIQIVTMPTASASNAGDIVQYVGTTTASYTTGYFYQCQESSGSYSWVQTDVQPSGGGPRDIFIAEYDVTTYADINAAYTAGKFILVSRSLNGTTMYALSDKTADGTYYFRSFSNSSNTNYGCYITSSGTWAVNSYSYATLSSPAFTGTPTAPTAATGTNNTQLATTAFVADAMTNTAEGVNSNLAPIEATTTASQAYAIGDYLVCGGQLYKVTSPIASGGTIVPTGSGANVAATTVSENLGTSGGVTGVKGNSESSYRTGDVNLTLANLGAGDAASKAVTDSTSASAISTGTSLVTERDVYYGLPSINGSHSYNSGNTYYAPTSAGTSGYLLQSNGSGAPSWVSKTIPSITYSSTDLTPGSSPLTTGTYYFVYE
jgi:hypothetical protein